MPTYERINGLLSVASNSPGAPTGYGMQMKHLIDRLVRHGIDTAILSNYGHEAGIVEYKTPYGKATHYPHSFIPHSLDVIPTWHEHHRRGKEHLPHAILTLYDVWVYNQLNYSGPIWSWVPIDHVTLPPMVRSFLEKPNVTPIAMAPHGQRVLDERGIESTYIPHAIDTTIFKPASTIAAKNIRTKLGISDDTYLVTMVAANKANGNFHRKAMFENVMAFKVFNKEHPNSKLYLHTDPRPVMGGVDFDAMLQACGLGEGQVVFPDHNELMIGLPHKLLAEIYTASDIVLGATYGEGFGVPVIEAQACGTPVIASNWAATQDLAGPTSYLVDGQLWWNQTQNALFMIPLIGQIYAALESHYEKWSGNTTDSESVEFAKQFDVERVWQSSWMPFLQQSFT